MMYAVTLLFALQLLLKFSQHLQFAGFFIFQKCHIVCVFR